MSAEARPLPVAERQGLFFHDNAKLMMLCLHTNSALHAIQTEFNRNFPGLKLDFIFHGDEKLNLSSRFHQPFSQTPVSEICPGCSGADIIIDETMTTKEVEELFENSWHLPAQVYANINGYWQKNRKTESSRLYQYAIQAN
jgi:hypothetical protein